MRNQLSFNAEKEFVTGLIKGTVSSQTGSKIGTGIYHSALGIYGFMDYISDVGFNNLGRGPMFTNHNSSQ